MTLREQHVNLARETPYAFACQRCLGCCRAKRIQVNPYEVGRLARPLGISTTTLIRRHTMNGSYLKFNAENVCPFLTADGCGVHRDRPLVCRLYPLGRHVAETGEEWFTEFESEPGCAGLRGADQTIQSYLEEQGALPFMRAADLYLALYWKLAVLVETPDGGHAPARVSRTSWADLDAAVGAYCRETHRPVPAADDEKMLLHIHAIETWAESP